MWWLSWCLASEPIGSAAPADWTVDELMALPDAQARLARVDAALSATVDYERSTRGIAVRAVLAELAAQERTDPAVVRGFLEAASSDDPTLRERAVAAARAGELPPSGAEPVQPGGDPPLEAAREFRDRRLARGTLTSASTAVIPIGSVYVPITSMSSALVVYEGPMPIGTRVFTERIGDLESRERIRKLSNNGLSAIGVGGAALLAFSAAGVVLVANEDYAAGATLLGVGYVSGFTVSTVGAFTIGRSRRYSALYEPDELEDAIQGYNAALQAELGLTDAQVLAIEGLDE